MKGIPINTTDKMKAIFMRVEWISSRIVSQIAQIKTPTVTNTYANTDEYVEHLTGYSGVSPSKMLKEYRDILLNIDVMIIEELKDLFIQLW